MYFPGDPLFPFDPIFNSVPDAKARERMICQFDLEATKPEWALGYIFDIVLRGQQGNARWIPTMPERTPSQTVGPYLHIGLTQGAYGAREIFSATVADAGVPGTHIRIEGRVLDGEGNVVPDALIEIWQADAQGRYAHPADGRPLASNSFRGFGRCPTDKDGGFAFDTVKPGRVPGPGGTTQAPHINVGVFSRGLLKRLFTRIYFAGEPANAADPILALVPADRRDTLHRQARRGQARPLPLRHPPAGRATRPCSSTREAAADHRQRRRSLLARPQFSTAKTESRFPPSMSCAVLVATALATAIARNTPLKTEATRRKRTARMTASWGWQRAHWHCQQPSSRGSRSGRHLEVVENSTAARGSEKVPRTCCRASDRT